MVRSYWCTCWHWQPACLAMCPVGLGCSKRSCWRPSPTTSARRPWPAALLLYRLIYVMLPLLLACIALLINEGKRLLFAKQAIRVASGMAAPILAVLVFLSGVVLLFSGATPEIDTRLEHMGFLIPHRLIDASHFGASLIGVLCLLLAQGLRRRLSAAWMLTITLLLFGALLSLLKGFDWEEATLLVLTAVLLAGVSSLLLPPQPFIRPALLTVLRTGERQRGGRFDLVVAVRLPRRTLQQSALVAIHPGRGRTTRSASGAGQRGGAGDCLVDLAAAYGPPGHPPAES